ncbi:hypothetical protein LI140_03010 [Phocaeicola dorei]|uniref:hypothetical protein n=1 Tax=Phocaeicola dorei TaxID=357276 RepID=UPI001C384FA7|nr:hypothetical protein [Phocaeicola dorei]MBV4238634.1 hypothetical protein [Phocaeicola dorei]MCB6461211.1 hypothetical protein [Phocaeicola dorei]MCB6746595.1 hypothetical protein [Phocaeicola dorei]MCB6771994.1 hypothetical protein [Phocaeicola dorei]MCB6790795.1 hypothetical protein [Phocaeicola dorei]
MGKFNFYQDCKVTSWERATFIVEASSYAEAVAIVRSWKGEDILGIIDSRLCYESRQFLFDTSEYLSPEENNGQPTIEIFDYSGNPIITNVPETIQSI